MLAWMRSLIKRASGSATYSPFHTTESSEASAGLAPASSTPPPSSRNMAETDFNFRVRIASISSDFFNGMVGTYQWTEGSSSTSPPANQATRSETNPLHDPQPLPARVAFITAGKLRLPPATQLPIAALV